MWIVCGDGCGGCKGVGVSEGVGEHGGDGEEQAEEWWDWDGEEWAEGSGESDIGEYEERREGVGELWGDVSGEWACARQARLATAWWAASGAPKGSRRFVCIGAQGSGAADMVPGLL